MAVDSSWSITPYSCKSDDFDNEYEYNGNDIRKLDSAISPNNENKSKKNDRDIVKSSTCDSEKINKKNSSIQEALLDACFELELDC